ncbi:glycosyltransferase family 1 protein [Roseovarius sp. MMSF_3448]|uniref:glycosyltransferase family 4 protein n=1 Tax=Roseovarius sp. MMSF_3448 TaxID=3046713 RepID=UPI00273E6706|nr:glycosyltransferase family 1 protein [Roseovarius sp. MMSF_3448]
MSVVYYDLSEQFLASGVKFQYYGIARTVMEVGCELAMSDADVKFVVFSPAHERFFEVTPRVGALSPTGILDPGLPRAATPKRMRYSFPTQNRLRDAIYPAAQWAVRKLNQKRWRHVSADMVKEVDLDGQILVSLGRPKIMADYLTVLDRAGIKVRLIPLLHDMFPLYGSTHLRQSTFTRNFLHDNRIVIRHAERLLSNSEFTKAEIDRFSASGHLPPRPPVIAVPLAHEMRQTDGPIVQTGPTEPYLLGVGTMTGRKNLECVLDAFMYLRETGRPVPTFVLAGARRKRTEAYVNNPRFETIRSHIHFALNPNQAELYKLYENALALMIPSRMEGWGLPLGEALWLGTPALASNAPVLKEVGGDLAEYFDPDNPRALAKLIDSLQSDPERYAALKARIAEGKPQLRSWKQVAQDILAATEAI